VRRINHDLKAPVSVLKWALAKLKRDGLGSSKFSARLDHIARTADRLFDLLAELVHTYDTQPATNCATTGEESKCVFDLRNLLSEAVQQKQPLAESKKGAILPELPPYPLPVKASQLELGRVFDNLIRNAFIHNPEGIQLKVTARRRGKINQISFVDNGTGIPSTFIRRLFDPGYSSNNAVDGGDQKSEGFGLKIVKQIVESLGGTIHISCEEEVGATFTISLPIAEGSMRDGVVVPIRASRKG